MPCFRSVQFASYYDQRCRHPHAAVRGAVLSGLPDRQRHRQAGSVRGPELRRHRAARCPRRQAEGHARRGAVEGELGSARTPHRVEREGLPAPDHPPQDRRARAVLRAVPPGARPSVDSGRRDHLLRREALVSAGGRRLARRHPEGARARRHPARHRRPAPAARAARRHRSVRGRGLQRPGDHLRPAARRSRRPDVRDHQREAHAAERVAPGQPLGPPAVPRRERWRRRTTSSGRSTIARTRRSTTRSSCSASAAAASRRRRSRRS